MADELKYLGLDTETGLTVTAQIYGEDGVQVGAAIAASEVGSTGIYIADMPAVASATYGVRFFNGSSVLGAGSIEWNGSEEVTLRDVEADIAALNDVTAAEVYAEFTSGSNEDVFKADVSALATQASVDTIDGIVDAIVADTNELQLASAAGQYDTADVSGLASQASVDVIDGIVDAIVADTNELQTNAAAGQYDTADVSGLATPADLSGLASQASVDVIDGIVDAILVDTSTSIPADIAAIDTSSAADIADAVWTEAFADHSGAAGSFGETIASIIGDTNELQLASAAGQYDTADVSGLATQASVDVIDGIVDAIVADTNELQTNAAAGQYDTADVSGLATPADLSGLATQASVDIIDGVVDAILVDTGTTLPNALGDLATQASVDVIDGIVDAILVDTGTTIPAAFVALNDISAADVYTEFTSGSNEDVFKADVSGLATQASLNAVDVVVDAILVDTSTDIPNAIAGLNDPSAADIADAVWEEATGDHNSAGTFGEIVQAGLTVDIDAIVDAVWDEAFIDHAVAGSFGLLLNNAATATSISNLNDPSAADIYAEFTSGSNEDAFKADVSGLATPADISSGLNTLNDITAADVYSEFTSGSNEDVFKADVSALATQASVTAINLVVDQILLDTAELQANQGLFVTATGFATPADITTAIAGLNDPSAADIYAEFTVGSNEDAFKADVAGLSTSADVTNSQNIILAAIGASSGSTTAGAVTAVDVEIDNSEVIADIGSLGLSVAVSQDEVTVEISDDEA